MPRRNNYADNAYCWLKRKGLADKYEHAGIYCIKIDNHIIYIGRSSNMLMRIAQHYVGIKQQSERKYRIIAEAQRKGHSIGFDVLYYAHAHDPAGIESEIGQKEGEYIRQYRPLLNTQVPKEENWKQFDVKTIDARAALDCIL